MSAGSFCGVSSITAFAKCLKVIDLIFKSTFTLYLTDFGCMVLSMNRAMN